jgi:hypothetical protein
MLADPATGAIAHAIQLAVASVFLLTGIAALLGVMTSRLARVIDRGRSLEQQWWNLTVDARAATRMEASNLDRRRRICSRSLNYCTTAALLICLVIVILFAEEFFATNLKWLGSAFFVAAMLALIGGLTCFLLEVHLATHTISFDPARFESSDRHHGSGVPRGHA